MKYDNLDNRYYGISLVNDQTVRKEAHTTQRDSFKSIKRLANHFINHPDPMVVPIYRFEVLEEEPEDNKFWGNYKYAYEMKRLFMLNDEEKRLITGLIWWGERGWHTNDALAFLQGQQDYPSLVEFMKVVLSQGRYLDLHCHNFLKDENGDYKMIDIESFIRHPMDDPRNDWIT